MKIKKELLVKFLELSAIQGEVENKEALINIDGNMEVISVSEGKHVALNGILTGKYETLGKVGIDNIKGLNTFLDNFESEDEITIAKKENKLVLESSNKKLKVSCILKAPEYIVNTITKDKFGDLLAKAKDNEFVMDKSIVSKIISVANSMKSNELFISGKDNQITLSLNDDRENNIISTFDLAGATKLTSFSIKISKILVNILKTIGDTVILSIKNDCPMMIKYVEDGDNYKMEFVYLVALLKK